MFSLMLFMFFFFLGLLAVLWLMQRRNDQQFRALNEDNAQLRVLLRALESRLDSRGAEASGKEENTAQEDPLLHLSFDRQPEAPLPKRDALELRNYD